jgi:hypothetical protein
MELLQGDELSAFGRAAADTGEAFFNIGFTVSRARLLN